MTLALVTLCIALAAALSTGPLPRLEIRARIRNRSTFLKQKTKTKMSFDEELQFVFNLKSQLHAGVNQVDALRFAISRTPEFALPNTRQALTSEANLLPALRKDATEHNFLANCVNLLEISSNSGSSVNGALTQIAQTLINRRKQEQLISTELASTKATVVVLAGLPILGLGMGLLLGADSLSWLLGSTAGRVCFLLGLGLELVGWLWIKRLLNRALADVA